MDDDSHKIGFMASDYPLIAEPLNLLETGRRWFSKVYKAERSVESSDAAMRTIDRNALLLVCLAVDDSTKRSKCSSQ